MTRFESEDDKDRQSLGTAGHSELQDHKIYETLRLFKTKNLLIFVRIVDVQLVVTLRQAPFRVNAQTLKKKNRHKFNAIRGTELTHIKIAEIVTRDQL